VTAETTTPPAGPGRARTTAPHAGAGRARATTAAGRDERLRVLCVVSGLNLGGAERLVVDLLNGLDPLRFAPAVAVMRDGELRRRLSSHVRVAAGLYGWSGDPRGVLRLTALMRSSRPHVVDVVGRGDVAFWGRLAALVAGGAVVVHSDHHGSYVPAEEPRRYAYHLVNRTLDRHTACFVNVSLAQRRFYRDLGLPGERMVVIHNGVDLGRFHPGAAGRAAARSTLGLADDAPVLGCVGSLTANKNHELLLQAVRLLHAGRPRLVCLIVGEGPERAALERRAAELGLAGVVRLLGLRRDVPAIMPAMDALAVVSRSESFSLVAIEAMASGVPVVAADSGGPREIVVPGETGFLVPNGDGAAFAAAAARLLDDPQEARRMGEAGRLRVERHFSLASMISGRSALYETLVADRRGRRRG
jgi:glycosyltransferase involved in cell wall biosynthesis